MQKKYKIINILLVCFFFATANTFSIWATDNNFQIFSNSYTTLNAFLSERKIEWQNEDLTIPKHLWEKRSKMVDTITESKNNKRYIIKKNTLLSIDTKDIFPNSFIFHRNKIYRAPYYIFVRQGDEKIEIINRTLAVKNMDNAKVMSNHIITDEVAPMIEIIALEEHEQKEGSIIFGKNITFLVKISDELAHLKNISIKKDTETLFEKTINQKNIFLKTITLFAEQEKNISLSIDASDQLDNQTQQNFIFQSMQKQPEIKVFLKEDVTFSKINKNNLGSYTIKIDKQQEMIIFFETEPQEAKVYALLEKMERQKFSGRAKFQKMNTDEGIRIDQSGNLYFYAEDKFGNKSEVEHLTITEETQENISIKAR